MVIQVSKEVIIDGVLKWYEYYGDKTSHRDPISTTDKYTDRKRKRERERETERKTWQFCHLTSAI